MGTQEARTGAGPRRLAGLLAAFALAALAGPASSSGPHASGAVVPDARSTILRHELSPVSAVPAGRRPVLPDFDGDGYADLAIGVPHEDVGRASKAGAVNVIYGSPLGLAAEGNQLWHQDHADMADRAEPGDRVGVTVVGADFDGDGFSDLAVGVMGENAGVTRAGAVSVLYGSAGGLTAERDQLWHQDSPGIRDRAERGDRFGQSLAAGDFDGDGFADLAVGMRFEDVGRIRDAGAVNVIYGSPEGLTARGNQLWHQDSPGIRGRAGAHEEIGWALAAGDFDGDGFDELVIGAAYDDHHDNRDGTVHVIRGSPRGLTAKGDQLWSQDSPGIRERTDERDQFGQTLAVGDFDGDGFADLAVGAWHEDFCRICNEGVVHVLYGSRRGLTATGDQLWHQDSPGVSDRVDPFDQFGQSLASGDFDRDGFDDLAMGSTREGLRTTAVNADHGALNVLYGTRRGLTAKGDQFWHQDSPGIREVAAPLDLFALGLGAADFDADGADDLVVGVRYEDGRLKDTGAVHVIRGSRRGLTATGNQLWHQDSPGILDRAERGDRFGWSMTTDRSASGSPGESRPGYSR